MQDYPGQLNAKDRLGQRSSYATTVVHDSISLAAFNFVQDQLQPPHLEEVRYDIDADRFCWKGLTGKSMLTGEWSDSLRNSLSPTIQWQPKA